MFSVDPPFIDSLTRHFSFKALKKIVLRQPAFEKITKNFENNNSPSLNSPKKLTKEEKEKILNIFSLIDIGGGENNNKIPIKSIHNNFLRVKSPARLEKIIELSK